jgi:hypothetical protein
MSTTSYWDKFLALTFPEFLRSLQDQNYLSTQEFLLLSKKITKHSQRTGLSNAHALKNLCSKNKVCFQSIYQLIHRYLTLDGLTPTQIRLRKKLETKCREEFKGKILDLSGF